jgi:hypothetical protein
MAAPLAQRWPEDQAGVSEAQQVGQLGRGGNLDGGFMAGPYM